MSDRVKRVQGLRSSGAAGAHKGRNPQEPLTKDEAIAEQIGEVRRHTVHFRDITFCCSKPSCCCTCKESNS